MSPGWRPYDRSPNSVVGDLRVYADVSGPVPGRTRELYAWLPPGYESDGGRRYPVVCLQDGHSLFDRDLKAETDDPAMHIEPGEWEVDETMTAGPSARASEGSGRRRVRSVPDGVRSAVRSPPRAHAVAHALKRAAREEGPSRLLEAAKVVTGDSEP